MTQGTQEVEYVPLYQNILSIIFKYQVPKKGTSCENTSDFTFSHSRSISDSTWSDISDCVAFSLGPVGGKCQRDPRSGRSSSSRFRQLHMSKALPPIFWEPLSHQKCPLGGPPPRGTGILDLRAFRNPLVLFVLMLPPSSSICKSAVQQSKICQT